jgi:hypothetical protein
MYLFFLLLILYSTFMFCSIFLSCNYHLYILPQNFDYLFICCLFSFYFCSIFHLFFLVSSSLFTSLELLFSCLYELPSLFLLLFRTFIFLLLLFLLVMFWEISGHLLQWLPTHRIHAPFNIIKLYFVFHPKGQYFCNHRDQAQFLYDPELCQWSTYCGRANALISNAPLHKWAHHTSLMARIHLINSAIYSGHALLWWPFVNEEGARKNLFHDWYCVVDWFYCCNINFGIIEQNVALQGRLEELWRN